MTAAEFLEKFPKVEANRNCLLDMACPSCGSRGSFSISVTAYHNVHDNGSWDTNYAEWSPSNSCWCNACDHQGTVREFTVSGLDEAINARKDK